MFNKAIIHQTPKGNFQFVGRVHKDLCNKTFPTIEEAKIAAIDVMLSIGETFPVGVAGE